VKFAPVPITTGRVDPKASLYVLEKIKSLAYTGIRTSDGPAPITVAMPTTLTRLFVELNRRVLWEALIYEELNVGDEGV
jgi:hypothetical protein